MKNKDLDCLYFPSPSESNPSPPTPTQEVPPGLDESWYMLIIRENEVYKEMEIGQIRVGK